MLPIQRGREPGAQHHLAVQRQGAQAVALHLHQLTARRRRRLGQARLPLAQQAHAPQQRPLHAGRREQARRRQRDRHRNLHGQPLRTEQPRVGVSR